MNRVAALLALFVFACGGSDTRSISSPTTAAIQMPTSVNITAGSPTPIPNGVFLSPLNTALVCTGQKPNVKFDRVHTVIPASSFPLTLTGSYQGCAKRVYAYYNFYPDGGGVEPFVTVPIEVDEAGNWRYTFASPPGHGQMFFNVRAQNAEGDDDGAGVKFMIDAH